MKRFLQKCKITAAALLLVSYFLPISSCSYTVPLDLGAAEQGAGPEQTAVEEKRVIFYPRAYLDPKEPASWLNFLGFTWPIFLLVLQWKSRGRRASWLLPSAGVLLSLLSAAVIYAWAGAGKPLIGAWVGWCASATLFAGFLAELTSGAGEGHGRKDQSRE